MTASTDALPLARRITEQAYRAGAPLVTTLFSDDEATLLRYRFAPDRASTMPRSGSTKEWPRHSKAARRGWPLQAETRHCCRMKTPTAWDGRIEPFAGLPARTGADYAPRDQLDDCGQRHSGLGRGDVSRRGAGCGAGQTVGGDLRDHAHQHGRSGEAHGRRTTPVCIGARRS